MSKFEEIIHNNEDPVEALIKLDSYVCLELLRLNKEYITMQDLIRLKQHCVMHINRCNRTIEAIRAMYASRLLDNMNQSLDEELRHREIHSIDELPYEFTEIAEHPRVLAADVENKKYYRSRNQKEEQELLELYKIV
jgi:hypothetical protein